MQLEQIFNPPPGMTASEVARRAGINRSTLHRIAAGDVEPTLATLRELAIVHGYDLRLDFTPLSDPNAAAAARVMLDQAFETVDVDPEIHRWILRLDRLGNDPLTVLQAAAHASSLLHRQGAVLFRGDTSALRLASAGESSKADWAISGAPAIGVYETHTGRPTKSILWAADVERASAALQETHRRVESAAAAHVIVAPAQDWVFVDPYTRGSVRYVAPIQMLLDCIGLGDDLEKAALNIAKEW